MRDKLIDLIESAENQRMALVLCCTVDELIDVPSREEYVADHLIANGALLIDIDVVAPENRPLIQTIADMPINEVLELIKAKQEGRLILPPCKMGDKIWFIVEYDGKHFLDEGEVGSIYKDNGEVWVSARYDSGVRLHIEDSFGKRVFLTKEEAEKALEEIKNETLDR